MRFILASLVMEWQAIDIAHLNLIDAEMRGLLLRAEKIFHTKAQSEDTQAQRIFR